MRIKSLTVEGFRAFPGRHELDFDAGAVLILGANGQGKTSLLDAVLWALTGRIDRFPDKGEKHIVSLYSESGEAFVGLRVGTRQGEDVLVGRRYDGKKQQLRLQVGDEEFQGEVASVKLLERLWPSAVQADDPFERLSSALQSSVYLQQDLLTGFIQADDKNERFEAVSELAGVGRITDLQVRLQNAKRNWTTATNHVISRTEELEEKARQLERDLESLSEDEVVDEGATKKEWARFWQELGKLDVGPREHSPWDSAEAASDLDRALRELDAVAESTSSKLARARRLLQDIETHSPPEIQQPADLRPKLEEAQENVEGARAELADAEKKAAEQRSHLLHLKEGQEELKALAGLALKHLGERCPVCDQEYDHEFTTRRLQALVESEGPKQGEDEADVIQSVSAELEELEKRAAELKAEFDQAQSEWREYEEWVEQIRSRASYLSLENTEFDNIETELKAIIGELEDEGDERSNLRTIGEELARTMAVASERTRRSELQKQLNTAKAELSVQQAETGARNSTGDIAQEIIERLRGAAEEVVARRLTALRPQLAAIYGRIDPHPTFTSAELVSEFIQGRGQLSPVVTDPITGVEVDEVVPYLSSSQLNALAVSVFLALNVGPVDVPLAVAMLDDPMQSLDEVNLLGLVDVLRRIRGRRQIIIATHDRRFAQLLQRKLRAVKEEQRTIVIELDGWNRKGPEISAWDVERDLSPLRIAA